MHVFFDTETYTFRPGLMAPPIVCVQWAVEDGRAFLMTKRGELAEEAGSLSGPTSNTFSSLLAYWLNQGATLVGHHVAYDLACFCAQDSALVQPVFRAYRENRVTDTMLRQQLADIGRGRHRGFYNGPVWIQMNYNLGDVGSRHGFKVDKADPWRMHYALLDDVRLSEWPDFRATVPDLSKGAAPGSFVTLHGDAAIKYALDDVHATRASFKGQAERYHPDLLCDEFFQARKFWSLDLAATWGLRTSLRGVQSLEKGAKERLTELEAMLGEPWAVVVLPDMANVLGRQWFDQLRAMYPSKPKKPGLQVRPSPDGMIVAGPPLVRKDGSRDTKSAQALMRVVCESERLTLRLTKNNGICLDSDACKGTGHPLLEAYAEASSMKKVLTNDVAALKRGVIVPIHTHFGMADTGRVTSANPNTMNPRRLAGVRECYVPRGFSA